MACAKRDTVKRYLASVGGVHPYMLRALNRLSERIPCSLLQGLQLVMAGRVPSLTTYIHLMYKALE